MAQLSKAEYLKRYMSTDNNKEDVSSKPKKKKRLKRKVNQPSSSKPAGFKIVDEDIDLAQIGSANGEIDDEQPTIAEVIDERPEEVKRMEVYAASDKWRKIGESKTQDYEKNEIENSPLRGTRHDSDSSPPRRRRHDSDNSPPKKNKNESDSSPPRRKRNDSDSSPPRRKRHDSDSSPSRRKRHDSDSSPPRRKRHDSDSSPPRRKRHDSDSSPPRRKRNDSDSSPPRRKRHDSDNSPPRRKRNDSDSSPPRRKRHDSDNSPPRRKRNDSDSSPPRRNRHDSDSSPPRRKSPESDSVAAKTLSGKLAGLSSAKDMKKEAQKLKIKEIEMFNKIGDDKLGRNAEAVFRDKTGRKRDLNAEKQVTDAKAAEWKSKYDSWGKGVAQGAAEQERVADMVHEMSKPLARSKDDADLDAHLKQQDREGDPMLQYMKQKKEAKKKGPKYPQYKGPAPAPNRFGIKPGYRWDGVDRGNGFEKKYFQSISKRKAVSADAYKWSTEDM